MSDMDDYLQRSLESLEEGVTLQESLRELPAGMDDLDELARLAAVLRESPHPVRSPESVRLGEQRILEQARQVTTPMQPAQKTGWSTNRNLLPALVGAALVFVILVGGLIGSAIWLIGSPGAKVSTISGLSGTVFVSDDQGTWVPAQEGDRIEARGSIRTEQDAYATLEYYDGSWTRISPSSELTLAQLDGGRGGVLQVTINQIAGTTQHDVKTFGS